MTMFLKVRATSGPKHTFYAPVQSVEAWPDDYEVLDPEQTETPGEPEYEASGDAPAKPKRRSTAKRSSKPKPPEQTSESETSPETSVGNPESEGDA